MLGRIMWLRPEVGTGARNKYSPHCTTLGEMVEIKGSHEDTVLERPPAFQVREFRYVCGTGIPLESHELWPESTSGPSLIPPLSKSSSVCTCLRIFILPHFPEVSASSSTTDGQIQKLIITVYFIIKDRLAKPQNMATSPGHFPLCASATAATLFRR